MLPLVLASIIGVYCISLVIYRLFMSPVAKFPGPKLPALTWWYEFYFDVIKHGQFYKEIERMHSVYGPIVRINPDEVHIKDPDWLPELYTASNRPRNKSYWFVGRTGGDSMFSTVSHSLHRKRRAAVNPFFSQKAVEDLEPVIRENAEKLCGRMKKLMESQDVVELDTAYMALTLDTVSHYSFGEPFGMLDQDNFGAERRAMFLQATESNITARHLPWIPDIMNSLPQKVAVSISPPIADFLSLQKEIEDKMKNTSSWDKADGKTHRTIFEELRDSDLPPQEKTVKRLVDEAVILLGAGGDTTAHTLSTLTYHLLTNPQVLQNLTEELDKAMPDPSKASTWGDLKQLPYLKATITEAHRITSVLTTRLIRVAPNEILRYKEWNIPAGTQIGMTTHWTHYDPEIFPDPMKFKPERFLNDSSDTEKYVLPFSKGARGCLGIHLASAELYLTVALMFRRFEFELFETTYDDVEITWDRFTGGARPGSKGVRVKVSKARP